jgi:hypothetical protein
MTIMEIDPKEPVFSKNAIEVLTISNELCLLFDNSDKYDKNDFLNILHRLLPLLYLKASLLKKVTATNPDTTERFVTEEQYELIFQTLKKLFSTGDVFYIVHKKETAVKVSLAEFLTDVYQDIKDFLVLYQKPSISAKENAINECVVLFEKHWGPKLLLSLQALHVLIYPASSKLFDKDIFE